MLAHTQRVQVVFVQETCESAAKQSGVRRQEAVGVRFGQLCDRWHAASELGDKGCWERFCEY